MLIVRCDICKSEIRKGEPLVNAIEMLVGEETVFQPVSAIKIHFCTPCWKLLTGQFEKKKSIAA